MPLAEEQIRATPTGEKPRKLSDGRGLFLLLNPNGSRYWRVDYRFTGKHKALSAGVYPAVTLKEARAERDRVRSMAAHGVNPSEHRKAERQARREAEERQLAAMQFSIDSDGALSIRLGGRRLNLTSTETAELRTFLDPTRAVPMKMEE